MVRLLFIFARNEFWKNANFFQNEPSVCLPRIACGEALGFRSYVVMLRCTTVCLHRILHEMLTDTGPRRTGSAAPISPLRK